VKPRGEVGTGLRGIDRFTKDHRARRSSANGGAAHHPSGGFSPFDRLGRPGRQYFANFSAPNGQYSPCAGIGLRSCVGTAQRFDQFLKTIDAWARVAASEESALGEKPYSERTDHRS